MNMTVSERHQARRLVDYREQTASALFQMYRILTTYFPDENITPVMDMQNILDTKLKQLVENISQR